MLLVVVLLNTPLVDVEPEPVPVVSGAVPLKVVTGMLELVEFLDTVEEVVVEYEPVPVGPAEDVEFALMEKE